MTFRRPPIPHAPVLVFAAALLAACGEAETEPAAPQPSEPAPAETPAPAPERNLAWALEGPWRLEEEHARDGALAPRETARLLGLDAAGAVLELWPRGGYWTAVFAPTMTTRAARYRAAVMPDALEADAGPGVGQAYALRFEDEALFGEIEVVELGPDTGSLAAPEAFEAAFAMDAVGPWVALGMAEKTFTEVYAALAPGGRLMIIEPRAAPGGVQDPGAANGYVQETFVQTLAEEAGFVLEVASELHANPRDDRDHPFGVWTLAPMRLTAPLGAPPDPTFDRSAYDAIGEPDRMTLVFRKPEAE